MKQKQFPLYEGLFEIDKIIEDTLPEQKKPFIILVAGWSASGKTSMVAKKIQEYYSGDAILLSMDNYYRGHEYYKKHNLNFDQPEALNLDLFFEHLADLKKGKKVKTPEYDFKVGKPEFDKIEVKPAKLIIVEGLFALHDKIASLGDIKIFVDLGTHGRILRRIFRDVKRTGQKPSDILKYFLDTAQPMHDKYIEPTKENANYIITNEYIPSLESKSSAYKDIQKKYDLGQKTPEKIGDTLLRLGAEYLGEVDYTDYFFHPFYTDPNISTESEVILIRRFFFGKYVLIYKGPRNKKKKVEERPIINFLIDEDVFEAFRETYWENMNIVSRKRASYFVRGNIFCLDTFENKQNYLEVKFHAFDKNTQAELKEIFDALGLDIKKGSESYYNDVI